MRIFGQPLRGPTAYSIPQDEVRVAYALCPEACRVPKLSLYASAPTAAAAVPLRAVIYDGGNNLVATGSEVLFPALSGGQWLDLPFPTPAGAPVAAGVAGIGYHAGAAGLSTFEGPDAQGRGGRKQTTAYSGGPPATLAGASTPAQIPVFATFVAATPRPDADDYYFSGLAYPDAEAALVAGGPIPNTTRYGNVGWHGTVLDELLPAFALVLEGGPNEDLIGERLRFTTQDGAQTTCFCIGSDDLDDDFSVARRAFMALGLLSADDAYCAVEVMN